VSAGHVLGTWEPAAAVGPLLAALVYVCAARGRGWPLHRTLFWLSGTAALFVAAGSGLDVYDDQLLSIHMVQHLVLTMVAAPLLAAGAPIRLALRASGRSGRRTIGRLLHHRIVHTLGWPPVALAIFAGVMIGTHTAGFYDLALRHESVHALDHMLYLSSALLFWIPLIGVDPVPRAPGFVGRTVMVLLAMTSMSIVGVGLVDAGSVRYEAYLAPARQLGVSALADQRTAGAIMWVGGALVGAVLVILLGWLALEREERRAQLAERRAEAAL
jgi:putative copper resistance protein D